MGRRLYTFSCVLLLSALFRELAPLGFSRWRAAFMQSLTISVREPWAFLKGTEQKHRRDQRPTLGGCGSPVPWPPPTQAALGKLTSQSAGVLVHQMAMVLRTGVPALGHREDSGNRSWSGLTVLLSMAGHP